MMAPMPHLVIMAGGTGGHIIPGLAVAHEAERRGWRVSWLGSARGMENRLVPPSGIALDTVGFSGLRGKDPIGMLAGSVRLVSAFGESFAILRRRRPDAVLGMGGYVCVPGGIVARALGLPLLLVNADAALLLSNKILLRFANRVAFGFDGSAARQTPSTRVTGNPVRAEIEAIATPSERFAGREGPLRVLVVGGSLGAKVLNETVPEALGHLAPADRPRVTHQTGQANLDAVRAKYAELGVEAEILPFIDDMPVRLAACDLLLCRAGAITVSEICAAGVASVLVPLVVRTTSHQRDNAQYMASQRAALHLPQTELSPEALAKLLRRLTRPELEDMAKRARALARPHAAARVVDELDVLVAH
jgi:UDP-N-acetylglucosamine--N-acetylmuramyl-(pentapeptide) pyrophosphoryl-undecaprenol N-acetylglucosamine transferase